MEDLKDGYEPDARILAPYRIPVETQRALHINSDNESLANITSEESSDAGVSSASGKESDDEWNCVLQVQ